MEIKRSDPLLKRFDAAIESAHFNFLELKGFQQAPRLALLAGMALGYKLGIEDGVRGTERREENE